MFQKEKADSRKEKELFCHALGEDLDNHVRPWGELGPAVAKGVWQG